ncbi:hypothetical protein GCM10025794_16170 [Massilia kyonggiensis]
MPTVNTDGSPPSDVAAGVRLFEPEFRPKVARPLLFMLAYDAYRFVRFDSE